MGKPKAEVAAERVMARVAGVTVTPHFCRIEDKPLHFYEQFHVIILGLDSLEARRFMNQVACSFLGARLRASTSLVSGGSNEVQCSKHISAPKCRIPVCCCHAAECDAEGRPKLSKR